MTYGEAFRNALKQGRRPMVAFLMLGDPSMEESVSRAIEVIRAGACALELGVPFSDPLFDGPVVQRAHERALAGGMKTNLVSGLLRKIRGVAGEVPLGLMMAANSFLRLSREGRSSLEEVSESILIPEFPIGYANPVSPNRRVLFVGPVTRSKERQKMLEGTLKEFVGPYIYVTGYVGVTGKSEIIGDLSGTIKMLKQNTDAPIVVGFGIRDAESADRALNAGADGLIVGSRLLEEFERDSRAATRILTELVSAQKS